MVCAPPSPLFCCGGGGGHFHTKVMVRPTLNLLPPPMVSSQFQGHVHVVVLVGYPISQGYAVVSRTSALELVPWIQ